MDTQNRRKKQRKIYLRQRSPGDSSCGHFDCAEERGPERDIAGDNSTSTFAPPGRWSLVKKCDVTQSVLQKLTTIISKQTVCFPSRRKLEAIRTHGTSGSRLDVDRDN